VLNPTDCSRVISALSVVAQSSNDIHEDEERCSPEKQQRAWRDRWRGAWYRSVRVPGRQFGLTNVCCQFRLTLMNTEDIAAAIASNDPSLGLRASLALHRLAERVEANHVAMAREKGWSWQQIGDALGVTRQSVHAKYNKESS
jgi:hypothetical protein